MVLNWIDLSWYFVLSGQERPLWVSDCSAELRPLCWLVDLSKKRLSQLVGLQLCKECQKIKPGVLHGKDQSSMNHIPREKTPKHIKKSLNADAWGSWLASAFWDTQTAGINTMVTMKMGGKGLSSACVVYVRSKTEFLSWWQQTG